MFIFAYFYFYFAILLFIIKLKVIDMKETKKQKQISIIIPNCQYSEIGKIETRLAKTIPEGYEPVYIFVLKEQKQKGNDQNHIFVNCPENLSLNSQIALGFSKVVGECAIVCNTESARYDEYVQEMISKWRLGAKIVRTKRSTPTDFWGKIGNFFVKLKNSVYNIFLKICGYSADSMCVNSFQLFDKQVYTLIKALPEKNAYFRNCLELKSFETVEISTSEKIKLKDDSLKWNTKLIVSASMLGLFVAFFVLSFVLYPLAKQHEASFTFVSLMILLCLGFSFGAVAFFYSAMLDNKIGYDEKLNDLLPKSTLQTAQDEAENETPLDKIDENEDADEDVDEDKSKKSNKTKRKRKSK